MADYTFNLGKAVVATVAAMLVIEALDDDDAPADEEFGQGGLFSGYFAGGLA